MTVMENMCAVFLDKKGGAKKKNIESEKEIPGAFTSGNKATVEECSDVSRTFKSCVKSKALMVLTFFKLSMKQTLIPVPVVRIMTYACLVTSG